MPTSIALRAHIVLAAILTVGPACSKEDAATPAPAPALPDPAPVEITSASASASASAPAPAPAPASAFAPAPASAPAPAHASASAKAAPTCGDKPLPPCPLYAWMKANTSAAMSSEDFDALAIALDKTATFAPAGYTNWASIAKDGASAARVQSLDAVKAACRGCHNQYKDKYKKGMRDRALAL